MAEFLEAIRTQDASNAEELSPSVPIDVSLNVSLRLTSQQAAVKRLHAGSVADPKAFAKNVRQLLLTGDEEVEIVRN